MPIVAHSPLPTFARMMTEGDNVLTQERALTQDIRELHIGFLNMMPDAAFQATERQFFRLIAACNRIAQFYIHPFTFAEIPRDQLTQTYINTYYEPFETLQAQGLDALIISGANPATNELTQEVFWQPLKATLDWAKIHVTSTLCACLASHATMEYFYQLKRRPLSEKRWGVYSHQVKIPSHPLVHQINTRFDVPHSRWNDIDRVQMQSAQLPILVESKKGGVHLATSPDGFRFVYFQGHPEYDRNSLLKEYKREVRYFLLGEKQDYPLFPVHYIDKKGKDLLLDFKRKALQQPHIQLLDDFPEQAVLMSIDNTWNDTGKMVINNWLGLVYQLTNRQRNLAFMEGVDPNNPLAAFMQHDAMD